MTVEEFARELSTLVREGRKRGKLNADDMRYWKRGLAILDRVGETATAKERRDYVDWWRKHCGIEEDAHEGR